MNKILVNPKELYDGSAFGMSQAVVDDATGLVFISGQVDWDEQHQVRSKDVSGQLDGAIRNLKVVLRESGCSVENLLSVRILIRGECGPHLGVAAEKLSVFLGDSRPAVTGIGVASLASPDTLVEIEAIARRS